MGTALVVYIVFNCNRHSVVKLLPENYLLLVVDNIDPNGSCVYGELNEMNLMAITKHLLTHDVMHGATLVVWAYRYFSYIH